MLIALPLTPYFVPVREFLRVETPNLANENCPKADLVSCLDCNALGESALIKFFLISIGNYFLNYQQWLKFLGHLPPL